MDLSLNQDQELIKGSVEKFIIETYDSESRRKTIKNNLGSDDNIWKQFAELGWLGLPFSEKDGGFNGDLMDLNIIMESFGRGLVVEPYISTVILSGSILSFCPDSAIRNKIINNIINGVNKVSFAYAEPNSRYNLNDVSTIAKLEDKQWVLNGHKSVVFGAGQSNYIIISARTSGNRYDESGISLFIVESNNPGLEIQDYPTVDGFKAAEVKLNDLKISADSLISKENEAYKIMKMSRDKTLVAVAAEASGIMSKMYEMTLEYIKTRKAILGRVTDNNLGNRFFTNDDFLSRVSARDYVIQNSYKLYGEEPGQLDMSQVKLYNQPKDFWDINYRLVTSQTNKESKIFIIEGLEKK